MFPDKFARIEEAVGAATNMVSRIASHDCRDPLLTDTRVPHHYDPARFDARATCRGFFHVRCVLTNYSGQLQALNLRFLRKFVVSTILLRKSGSGVPESLQ